MLALLKTLITFAAALETKRRSGRQYWIRIRLIERLVERRWMSFQGCGILGNKISKKAKKVLAVLKKYLPLSPR